MKYRFILALTVLILLSLSAMGQEQTKDISSLINDLKDQNKTIRADAAVALGQLKDPRAIDPLKRALQDQDPAVRDEAAIALKKLQGKQGIP